MHPGRLIVSVAAILIMTPAHAHDVPGSQMADAAKRFLDSLDTPQRAKAELPFTGSERDHWNFVPMTRAGAVMKGLGVPSRDLAGAMLKTALSEQGIATVEAIIALENVLREMEGRQHRDPDLYYIAIFGTPGVIPWGWRFEGHHVSLNYTVAGEGARISATPSFLGANPAEVRIAPWKGQRALAVEEDLGRAFANSLSEAQFAQALISATAPADIVTGNDRTANPGPVVGLRFDGMSTTQRTDFLELLHHYLRRHRAEVADAAFARIEAAGIDNVCFAWAGQRTPGQGHYYRLHGPTFIIEYDNTQNGANHIHTVWRDFGGDFGRDLLREHLIRDHGVN